MCACMQGDKQDREAMRRKEAIKRKADKAQRDADEALMEPAKLASYGLSVDTIMQNVTRMKLDVSRETVERLVEKAAKKEAASLEQPFFSTTKVSLCAGSPIRSM